MNQLRANPSLLVRVAGVLCALPLAEVVETMRPLPVEPLADAPDFILGMACIRGAAVPVVRLPALFQGDHHGDPLTRFVTLRVGQRCIALAVQSIAGVADLDEQVFGSLPPLLQSARTEFVQAMGTLDAEFLVTLNTARLIPDSVWQTLAPSRDTQ